MANLDDVMAMLQKMQDHMGSMTDRIGALETSGVKNTESGSEVKEEPKEKPEETFVAAPREKQLTKTVV